MKELKEKRGSSFTAGFSPLPAFTNIDNVGGSSKLE